MALAVNVRVAVYDPVWNAGLFVTVKLVCIVLGLTELHDPPPPVQALDGNVTTLVCRVVDVVCVHEHGVPRLAELQV